MQPPDVTVARRPLWQTEHGRQPAVVRVVSGGALPQVTFCV